MDATLPTTEADRQKKLQAGLRIMEARRNRYLAMLGQDLAGFLRETPSKADTERSRRREGSVRALTELLDVEAEATLGQAALEMTPGGPA